MILIDSATGPNFTGVLRNLPYRTSEADVEHELKTCKITYQKLELKRDNEGRVQQAKVHVNNKDAAKALLKLHGTTFLDRSLKVSFPDIETEEPEVIEPYNPPAEEGKTHPVHPPPTPTQTQTQTQTQTPSPVQPPTTHAKGPEAKHAPKTVAPTAPTAPAPPKTAIVIPEGASAWSLSPAMQLAIADQNGKVEVYKGIPKVLSGKTKTKKKASAPKKPAKGKH